MIESKTTVIKRIVLLVAFSLLIVTALLHPAFDSPANKIYQYSGISTDYRHLPSGRIVTQTSPSGASAHIFHAILLGLSFLFATYGAYSVMKSDFLREGSEARGWAVGCLYASVVLQVVAWMPVPFM